jgi:hypothetical protein
MSRAIVVAALVFVSVATAFGKHESLIDIEHPAIQYTNGHLNDPGARLNFRLQYSEVHLKFNGPQGYLRALLDELNIPIDSQIVVFSKTSFQSERISPQNPRSLFFNDSVIVGWVRGGPVIEIASEDPQQGMIFYKMGQRLDGPVHLDRDVNCLSCHIAPENAGLPSTLMRSVYPGSDGTPLTALGTYLTDDRSPFAQRWGGWYVTGSTGSAVHMGNEDVAVPGPALQPLQPNELHTRASLKGLFDTNSYLSPYSDVVALMVFEHEMHMMNLLTQVGWKTRLALYQREQNPSWGVRRATEHLLRDTSREFVDYMLFADEAPLMDNVQGTSGFEEEFSKRGPDDSKGRSLRQFDLQRRLMRYPCSFMIYSDAFDGLPDEAKDVIYHRMWQILSGQDRAEKYKKFSLDDRKAIVEILRDTKRRLPDYFQASNIAR